MRITVVDLSQIQVSESLIEKHSFLHSFVFRTKTTILSTNRHISDLIQQRPKFVPTTELVECPIISESKTKLYNVEDSATESALTNGKVQNLRTAIKFIHGIEIPENVEFSFWNQIGNPRFNSRFVVGREIQEGCVVPVKAGGICQLSNALYDAALKASFEITERHKHTKIIKGSLAEIDRDATVKYRHIDLRFQHSEAFRIEAILTNSHLIIRFKSKKSGISYNKTKNQEADQLNNCSSCGTISCNLHSPQIVTTDNLDSTTWLLDEQWPEHNAYLNENASKNDVFVLPKSIKTTRFDWKGIDRKTEIIFPAIIRSILFRYKRENIFKKSIQLDRYISKYFIKKIPVNSRHIVVSQNLLPFLVESGALGGRTYDVLMTRFPIFLIHETLNGATQIHPDSPTLNDFRADNSLVETEKIGLKNARRLITPHQKIAQCFPENSFLINWTLNPKTKATSGTKILFPGSGLGRKGAYEVRQLAREMNLELAVLGNAKEHEHFWEGINTSKFENTWDEIKLVIFPAFVENRPAYLLKALERGIPVIATENCGISHPDIHIVPAGNYLALRENFLELSK